MKWLKNLFRRDEVKKYPNMHSLAKDIAILGAEVSQLRHDVRNVHQIFIVSNTELFTTQERMREVIDDIKNSKYKDLSKLRSRLRRNG